MSNKKNAFTLVEMLIAVILITLLIGVAIFAFRYQLIAIKKSQKVGFTHALSYNQLRTSLESMKYYVVDNYDMLNQPMKQLHIFFKGNPTELTYITDSPLFSKEVSLAKLSCKDSELLYTEVKLYGQINYLKPALPQDASKVVLYKNLKDCSFKYHIKELTYDTLKNRMPTAITLKLNSHNKTQEIYINIQSDYNISVGIINDAIYPIE